MAGPLYRQIAEELRLRIDSGQLEPGSQLPTEDELMEQHHASRNTVRGAINQLAISGLVITLHGKGTFVAEQVNPIVTTLTTDPETGSGGGEGLVYTAEVSRSGRTATTSRTRVELQQATKQVADSLNIPVGSGVISLARAALRGREALVPSDVVLSPDIGGACPAVGGPGGHR